MSYKEEYLALWDWYNKKFDEYIKASDEEEIRGLGSLLDAAHQQDTLEFNRRLGALQKKYGVRPGDKSLLE